jgi:multiple sugar transport system ATP-binding protein
VADVQLEGVTKRYGSVEACTGVDLHVDDGEFVTLLGPSGCGKSTTLNVIAGLESVTSGEICMGGVRVNELTPYERDVAMVFQNYALYPNMTVAQNIGFAMLLRRRPKAEIAERVRSVAALLELIPFLDRLPRELSGGQQQRVALGRAVIREPRLFLFDEPLSNLDAALRVRMRIEIKELHQRLGVTSIFVTHDQEEAMSISDRIAVMRGGRVEQYGTPGEIYLRPATRNVALFIGNPQMDILDGAFERNGDAAAFRVGTAAFALPEWIASAVIAAAGDEPVQLGVRAESVMLGDRGPEATVRIVQPIGPSTYVTVGWQGGTLTSRLAGLANVHPGKTVRVSLDPNGLHVFGKMTGARLNVDR